MEFVEPERKMACGDNPPRRPITKHDNINKILMAPAEKIARFGWNLLKKYDLADAVSAKTMDFITPLYKKFFTAAYGLTVTGQENIPEGGAIIAPNHSSWMDVNVLAPSLPKRAQFMAKAELLEVPLTGIFMEMCGAIPIERYCIDSSGLKKAIDLLRKGEHLVIFPEGTIPGEEDMTRDDVEPDTGLLPGNAGAVILALKTKVPIVPVGIKNTDIALPPEVYPRMEKLPPLSFPKVSIEFGKPIYFDEYYGKKMTSDIVDPLIKNVMIEIGKLCGRRPGKIVA